MDLEFAFSSTALDAVLHFAIFAAVFVVCQNLVRVKSKQMFQFNHVNELSNHASIIN